MVSNVKYKNLNKFSTTFPPVGLMIVEGWSWWEWRNRIVAQNYYEIRTQFATSFLFRAIGRRFANQVVVILTSNDIPGYLHLLCRIGAVESGIIISGCRYREPECWNVSHCQLTNWQRCIPDVSTYVWKIIAHCHMLNCRWKYMKYEEFAQCMPISFEAHYGDDLQFEQVQVITIVSESFNNNNYIII